MAFKIICLGKTKEDWIKQGIAEYQKRLSSVWKIQWVELPDISLKTVDSIEAVKIKEAGIIQKALSPDDFVIALDEHGKSMTSIEFSSLLTELIPGKDVVFLVGGVYGLDYNILKAAKFRLSFSIFTFPHRLIRLILMEQLYRAWTIMTGKTYHY